MNELYVYSCHNIEFPQNMSYSFIIYNEKKIYTCVFNNYCLFSALRVPSQLHDDIHSVYEIIAEINGRISNVR